MTPKKNRASKKILDKIWQRSKTIRSGEIIFKFVLEEKSSSPKISFTVPKSTGTAAFRNNLRRRGYAVVHTYLSSLPKGLTGIMIFNPKKESEKSFDHIDKLVSEIFTNFL